MSPHPKILNFVTNVEKWGHPFQWTHFLVVYACACILLFRYIKSETDRVKSLLEMKKLKSQKQSAQSILESLKADTFSMDQGKNK